MQIPIFATADDLDDALDLVGGKLDPLAFECVPYHDWMAFGEACREVLAGVVVSSTTGPELRRRLASLREGVTAGLVWVQRQPRGRSRRVEAPEGIIAVQVSAIERDPFLFPARYHQARTAGFLRGQAVRVSGAAHLTRDLRRFAVQGLVADPPYPSNRAYAAGCRCSPRHLESRFRVLPEVTPKGLRQAVLVVHIGMRRPFGCPWEWLGSELRLDPQRFPRVTKKHLDCTPSEAEEGHGERVMTWFSGYLTRAFRLDPPPSGHGGEASHPFRS